MEQGVLASLCNCNKHTGGQTPFWEGKTHIEAIIEQEKETRGAFCKNLELCISFPKSGAGKQFFKTRRYEVFLGKRCNLMLISLCLSSIP